MRQRRLSTPMQSTAAFILRLRESEVCIPAMGKDYQAYCLNIKCAPSGRET